MSTILSTTFRRMICDAIKDNDTIDYAGITRLISKELFGMTPSEMREARPTDSGSLATSARLVMTKEELSLVAMTEGLVAVTLRHQGDEASPIAVVKKAAKAAKSML